MFEKLFQRIENFNELKGCKGTYTLIDRDDEIIFTTPTDSISFPTYKDKESYLVFLGKPNKELGGLNCIQVVVSAGYDEETNSRYIKGLTKFMDNVEGTTLFNS